MGTRNLTAVYIDGKCKVAQYAQWDGYPEGQGRTVFDFLKVAIESGTIDEFKDRVRALGELSDEELKAAWTECGADPESDYVNMDVSSRFQSEYPQWHRNCGADILAMILAGTVEKVRLDEEFAADSLFCEWAYAIDLDANRLEVFQGFQREAHADGRYAEMETEDDSEYAPVREIARFEFDAMPSWDGFLEQVNAATASETEE